MKTREAAGDKSFPVTSLLVVAALVVALAIVFTSHGDLSWDTRLFTHDRGWLSGILFLSACIIFFKGCRSTEWDAFAPIRFFYTVWFGLLAIGCLRLTTAEQPFTLRFWVTVSCGLLGFFLGAKYAHRAFDGRPRILMSKLRDRWKVNWQPSRALSLIGFFFIVCLLAFAYEYWRAGSVPLLSDDPESARFNFGVNSYVQRFAISFYLLAFLGYVGFAHLKKYHALFLAIATFSACAITLLTARSLLLSAVWMAIVLFHYGRRRMTVGMVLLVVSIGYPLAKVAVDAKRFYENPAFIAMLDKIEFPEKLRVVGPDYLYFSMTLQTLDNLTHLVPNEIGYSYGWYIGYPVRVFWTPREGGGFRGRLDDLFWERSTDWSPVPSVTTAYMGVPYADFGIPGVFFFSLFFGWVSSWLYESLRREPSFWRAFLYAEVSFAMLISIYANYLTLFDLYWNLLVVGLIHRWSSNQSQLDAVHVGHEDALPV